MKKSIITVVAMMLVAAMVLGACVQKVEPTPAPAPPLQHPLLPPPKHLLLQQQHPSLPLPRLPLWKLKCSKSAKLA